MTPLHRRVIALELAQSAGGLRVVSAPPGLSDAALAAWEDAHVPATKPNELVVVVRRFGNGTQPLPAPPAPRGEEGVLL